MEVYAKFISSLPFTFIGSWFYWFEKKKKKELGGEY